MNRLHKFKKAGILLLIPLILTGCKKENTEEEKSRTVVCTDFVSYDITRKITEGTDITVEGIDFSSIDWEKGISGRDRNKINKSLLFINGTWLDESKTGEFKEGLNKIELKDFSERKKNDKNNNKLYSGFSFTEEEDNDGSTIKNPGAQQVIANPNAGKDKDKDKDKNGNKEDNDGNTDKPSENDKGSEDSQKPSDTETEAPDQDTPDKNEEDGNKADKDGLRLWFTDKSYQGPPVSCDKNGKSLGSYVAGDEIVGSEAAGDKYQLWLCDRIMNMFENCGHAVIDNGNGTYTVFADETALTPRFKVLGSLDDIKFTETFTWKDVMCESGARGMLGAYSDCFMEGQLNAAADKKLMLANTADFAEGFWLDVKNARKFAEEVKNRMCEADAANRDIYEENYAKLDGELASLDDKFQYTADSSKNHLIFIGGGFVYGYMVDSYGIDYVSIYDYSTQDESATPTRLMNFAELIDRYKIKYIVKDKKSTMDGINSVKAEIDHNLNTLIIDTLEHVDDWENSSYLDLMDDNCTIFKKALY